MALIPLFPGHAFIEVGDDRYHLQVEDGGVLISGGVLARPILMDDLVDIGLELGLAADELLGCPDREEGPDLIQGELPSLPDPTEGPPTATCPRCGYSSAEIFQTMCCSRCGHGWRDAPDDDPQDRPRGAGGGR